jgi:hypothetical protein
MNVRWTGVMVVGFVLAGAIACSSGEPAVDPTPTIELVKSLRAKSLPGLPDPLTPEKALELEKLRRGPGGFFIEKGCFACHDVSVHGIKSTAAVGPDLSLAVEDVQSRFGMSLEQFFAAPVGTMSVVLTQMLVLTPEEKTQAMAKLHEAYQEHERRKRGAAGDKDDDKDDKDHGKGRGR